MMLLPFLKEKKWPRIAKPTESKEYGLSDDEEMQMSCISELMQAAESKDPKLFRQAVEALVLSLFEMGELNAT